MEYLSCLISHMVYSFVFMIFSLRSWAKKLKMLFDPSELGQRNWNCLGFCTTWHKPMALGETCKTDFCQICHMELLCSNYRGFPGCLPGLGIIDALQDFCLTRIT